MVSIFTIFVIDIESGMHFQKIGIKSGIHVGKFGIRNGYVFETSMARPRAKFGQVSPPPGDSASFIFNIVQNQTKYE